MFKNFLSLLLRFSVILLISSCSSDIAEVKPKTKLLSFNIYDQKLETLLEKVADRYNLSLDFDVDETDKPYSLSVINASISDILKKLEADTGFFMKVVDDEILVEEEMLDEDMTEITLALNGNLWKDIRAVSKNIDISEEVVQNFFGPLFSNALVTDIDSGSKTIELYLPIEDIDFIKKSLLYLNYLKHRRNLAVSIFVVKKDLSQKFIDGKASNKEADFAWKMNAGDKIVFTDGKGNKVDLQTQLLSDAANIAAAEVFVKLTFNKDSAENNFNFSKEPVQMASLSDKLALIVKPEWYTDGERISPENLNSHILAQYQKEVSNKTAEALKTSKSVTTGIHPINKSLASFNSKGFSIRYISVKSGGTSDISAYKINCSKEKETLQGILNKLPKGTSYFKDEDGVLIDCQGTIRSQRNIQWKISRKKPDSSYFKFLNGAFIFDKEGLNQPVIYLPSANALVGYVNSNILK